MTGCVGTAADAIPPEDPPDTIKQPSPFPTVDCTFEYPEGMLPPPHEQTCNKFLAALVRRRLRLYGLLAAASTSYVLLAATRAGAAPPRQSEVIDMSVSLADRSSLV